MYLTLKEITLDGLQKQEDGYVVTNTRELQKCFDWVHYHGEFVKVYVPAGITILDATIKVGAILNTFEVNILQIGNKDSKWFYIFPDIDCLPTPPIRIFNSK